MIHHIRLIYLISKSLLLKHIQVFKSLTSISFQAFLPQPDHCRPGRAPEDVVSRRMCPGPLCGSGSEKSFCCSSLILDGECSPTWPRSSSSTLTRSVNTLAPSSSMKFFLRERMVIVFRPSKVPFDTFGCMVYF